MDRQAWLSSDEEKMPQELVLRDVQDSIPAQRVRYCQHRLPAKNPFYLFRTIEPEELVQQTLVPFSPEIYGEKVSLIS